MASSAFDRIAARSTKDSKIFVSKAFDIREQVMEILHRQGRNQKDLAQALGKSESEISKWLNGIHNLTLKTIALMEAELGEEIIVTTHK